METDAERDRLLERDAAWAKFAAEGREVDEIVSYWTDDATVIPPGIAEVVGKDALRQYVEGSLKVPGFQISWSSSGAVMSDDGTMAYLLGTNEVTLDGPDGTPITMPGRVVTIWRREPDGEWRCVVDIWNSPAE